MDDKKVIIFTTYYKNNKYGGVLQAYALQKYIKTLGYDVTTASYEDKYIVFSPEDDHGVRSFLGKVRRLGDKRSYKKLRRYLLMGLNKDLVDKIKSRDRSFEKFREVAITHTDHVLNDANVRRCVDLYDIFICGSDLVWNIAETEELQKGYWLTFVEDKTKIAYAPSIPMYFLRDIQKELIRSALSDFSSISVREDIGKDLLDTLNIGKKIYHVVDPVFLLTREEWKNTSIHSRFSQMDGPYILTYFLGREEKYRTLASWIARYLGIKIFNIAHANGFCIEDLMFGEPLIDIDPYDFIALFCNCELVITDSFHGAAFSLIFGKEFYTVERFKDPTTCDLNARLTSLLRMMKVEENMLDHDDLDSAFARFTRLHVRPVHYGGILSERIDRSKEYLNSALRSQEVEE